MKHHGEFKDIESEKIEKALLKTNRQYFVGSLKLPQIIKHIDEEDLEIGITNYKEETAEDPHWHPTQKEYQYMLSGETTYIDAITMEAVTYKEGDFYAIYPEICYKQHSLPGTRILFIKTPSINDKVVCYKCSKEDCPSRIEEYKTGCTIE